MGARTRNDGGDRRNSRCPRRRPGRRVVGATVVGAVVGLDVAGVEGEVVATLGDVVTGGVVVTTAVVEDVVTTAAVVVVPGVSATPVVAGGDVEGEPVTGARIESAICVIADIAPPMPPPPVVGDAVAALEDDVAARGHRSARSTNTRAVDRSTRRTLPTLPLDGPHRALDRADRDLQAQRWRGVGRQTSRGRTGSAAPAAGATRKSAASSIAREDVRRSCEGDPPRVVRLVGALGARTGAR